MNFAKLALFAAAAITVTPAAVSAQDVGATIYGNDDQPIGTVESNDGSVVTVDTGTYKAPLPAGAFAELDIGWVVNATQAQVNGMMQAQVAAANERRDAALVVGAPVMTADNLAAGTVMSIDNAADAIILDRGEEGVVTLKREHFAADESGTLTALFTFEQIAANTVEVPEGAQIATSQDEAEEEAETAATTAGNEGAAGASD